jgi:hypothetical protein
MLLNIMEKIVNPDVIQNLMIPAPISIEVVMMCLHPSHVELLTIGLEIAT